MLNCNSTYRFLLLYVIALPLFFAGCNSTPEKPSLFSVLHAEETGLQFTNDLKAGRDFNLFRYMYFYNGAGVGAGDFNNDGSIDLFFASNQDQNRLYLNKGNCKFEDITDKTKIPNDGAWSTGISVVDINNDGMLDIYVCRVGKYETLNGHNQLLICTGIDAGGIPTYVDSAREYGLDFSGLSTQTAFLDYDLDGDLDMFLLNHAVHQNGTFRPRKEFIGTYHELSGDRFFRNELIQAGGQLQSTNRFTDVTREVGINSSAIGYGLGICVSDINLDGYPDIYIGNDFHENDYLYINQRNGTFIEEGGQRLMHTSQFSMGVDIADADNDGFPEIISVDMLPEDPYILKRSLGEDAYDIFHEKIRNGYNYQYARNNLQWNRRNGLFSEVGLYAGIFATDWSWGPLWFDFDNDGLKDLFISNGIPKRMNDIDYINYVSSSEIQKKIQDRKIDETDMALIEKFPQIKIPNKFFRNSGNMSFTDMKDSMADNPSTYSNGGVYADFDMDGDLDIVVSNINEPAILYRNETTKRYDSTHLTIKLKGPPGNINAIGAKVILFAGSDTRIHEKTAVHGFLSSMEAPVHIGIKGSNVDSAFVVWPDNTYSPLDISAPVAGQISIAYRSGLPVFNYEKITSRHKNHTTPIKNITGETGLQYRHVENNFVEFDREPLIPHMVSTEGPALAKADINGDGLEDIFIGASKRGSNAVFIQTPSGKFEKTIQPALRQDSVYEDVDACWADVNGDAKPDLIVASGGNEYFGKDAHLSPRVYLNDGSGKLTRLPNAFEQIYMTASCVQPVDFDGDGKMDLFIGGRAVPWAYGQTPQSYLFQNDGTGRFKDVTHTRAPELSLAGFVTDAEWFDLDNDGDKDLVLALEWNGITAFINNRGAFIKKMLNERKGWWNFILPADLDNDGDLDLVAGNLGLNTRLKASEKEPVRLYYNDFDDNGKKDQIVTYYLQHKQIPFNNKAELEKQMPVLRKRFLYAENFAKAQLTDLFTEEKLREAEKLSADYFANSILLNHGNGRFELKSLPWQAQLTPYRDALIVNANNDSLPDIFMAGNFYGNNIEMGRSDEDFGTILVNGGNGSFTCSPINGMQLKGQVRHIRELNIGNTKAFILARNNDSTVVMRFDGAGR
jgi:enediyne biosynthesis protein E4